MTKILYSSIALVAVTTTFFTPQGPLIAAATITSNLPSSTAIPLLKKDQSLFKSDTSSGRKLLSRIEKSINVDHEDEDGEDDDDVIDFHLPHISIPSPDSYPVVWDGVEGDVGRQFNRSLKSDKSEKKDNSRKSLKSSKSSKTDKLVVTNKPTMPPSRHPTASPTKSPTKKSKKHDTHVPTKLPTRLPTETSTRIGSYEETILVSHYCDQESNSYAFRFQAREEQVNQINQIRKG
eukprot:jgi/Psemu1/21674/gm1.21674_g